MVDMERMEGQKVVVIGGSSGIGLATARMAADFGAEAILFLMNNKCMTGNTVFVDGGMTFR
jgi:NADPH:quinone reductase-like Zn-dependent oxidoreductase